MSVMLYAEATFVKKNSCLFGEIVSVDTAGLNLLTFRILEPYPEADLGLQQHPRWSTL